MTPATRSSTHCSCVANVSEKAVEGVLAAIEPTRLRIMFLIGERGRMCVGDIAKQFKISRPAISHHLKVLKTYGLVETERAGQEIFYTLCRNGVADTLRVLADALDSCCGSAGREAR